MDESCFKLKQAYHSYTALAICVAGRGCLNLGAARPVSEAWSVRIVQRPRRRDKDGIQGQYTSREDIE